MRASEQRADRPPEPGRYAVLGILILAITLAGVGGGHQWLGAALGAPDGEGGFGPAPADRAACPPDLRENGACESDDEADRPGADAAGCGLDGSSPEDARP